MKNCSHVSSYCTKPHPLHWPSQLVGVALLYYPNDPQTVQNWPSPEATHTHTHQCMHIIHISMHYKHTNSKRKYIPKPVMQHLLSLIQWATTPIMPYCTSKAHHNGCTILLHMHVEEWYTNTHVHIIYCIYHTPSHYTKWNCSVCIVYAHVL